MTKDDFRKLIERQESETLDFKENLYRFKESKECKNDFVKDVLSMANTPREQSAYIVFGVQSGPKTENENVVVGLQHQIDDADLQNQFPKNWIQPVPRFTYFGFRFCGKQVGVLEIPVGRDGPYVPIQDIGSMPHGVVNYRRGTQNARASGNEIRRIHNWFETGDAGVPDEQSTNSWRQLLDAIHRFEEGVTYILALDRILPQTDTAVEILGKPPWRAIIDFDPDSESSGFLKHIAGTLEHHRVIHRVVRGDYKMQPEPGTHWFFARGLSGRDSTLSAGRHREWARTYKRELEEQLRLIANTVAPSPIVVLVLWSDERLRLHLRTLIEELDIAFGDAVEVVFVADDARAFTGFFGDVEVKSISMHLQSLCHGVADHYRSNVDGDDGRYVLPSLSGAPVEVETSDWLWLSEDLELVHRDIELAGDADARSYRLGADISWRNLHLRHDCDRDITPEVRSRVEYELQRRQTVRINIYHAPGSGGTTVGRRIAWDLHTRYPVAILRKCTSHDTARRIAKVAELTEQTILILVDGGLHSEREIDDLHEFLRAGQIPAVLLQVLRRFHRRATTGSRQFRLDEALTNAEADRFREAYIESAPHRSSELSTLAAQSTQRSAFFFGLTAFEEDFLGLHGYVKKRIADLTEEQRKILIYISMAYYYGQQSVPTHAFAFLMGLPRSKVVMLANAFTGDARKALGLLVESQKGEQRTSHNLVALEIMRQMLAPKEAREVEAVWRQNLSAWCKQFADFCRGDEQATSDRLLELIRRVFIYRDNVEMLGTERSAQSQFSQLIEDISSKHGKIDVLRYVTDCFPHEAHFHSHLARLLSLNNEHDKALECADRALEIQPRDHVLHHMRGMVLRESMRAHISERASIERLVGIAKEATASFEEARRLQPEQKHGYVSEVQLLIMLVDYAGRGREDVVREVLTRPETDPFLRRALERAEDLLDQVHRLYAGEQPSRYVTDCRARLARFYGDHQAALQAWDSLLARPEVAKAPVRRQIVWTILKRHEGVWEKITRKETSRIQRLLEENLDEEISDSTSLRLWLRAIRQSSKPPSLDSIIEKVSYWKMNTSSLDAAYYMYVLHVLRALDGSSQGMADAEQALMECRSLARYRRDRTRSFEWIGAGDGVSGLIHQSRLGSWDMDFWESYDVLLQLRGVISAIDGPQKGFIELNTGLKAFFVPAKHDFHQSRDENIPVRFYLGFSYDGPRAWDVRRIGEEEDDTGTLGS